MSKPIIIGITVSVDIADKDYGKGTDGFFSLKGQYPDPASLDHVLVDGLDMYFAAWKSLMCGRYATGVVSGPEFKATVAKTEVKFNKIRTFLLKEASSDAQ
jgi:hypothetical protein